METVDVQGLRIAFERSGAGPPVLLLHGGLADHREWSAQQALADEFTVVAWDAPGCGRSSDPPASFGMPDYADALTGFIRAVGIDRPHVVGLSFGATLALELQRRAPGTARTLVLASAYAGWAGSLPAAVVAERLASSLALLDQSPPALAEAFVETLLSDSAPPEHTEAVRKMLLDFHPAGARTMLHAMATCDLRAMLGTVDVPTLLVHGERDVRSPLHVATTLHTAIPHSTLTVLPGVGHQCNIEAATAFTAEVRRFLRSCDAR